MSPFFFPSSGRPPYRPPLDPLFFRLPLFVVPLFCGTDPPPVCPSTLDTLFLRRILPRFAPPPRCGLFPNPRIHCPFFFPPFSGPNFRCDFPFLIFAIPPIFGRPRLSPVGESVPGLFPLHACIFFERAQVSPCFRAQSFPGSSFLSKAFPSRRGTFYLGLCVVCLETMTALRCRWATASCVFSVVGSGSRVLAHSPYFPAHTIVF